MTTKDKITLLCNEIADELDPARFAELVVELHKLLEEEMD